MVFTPSSFDLRMDLMDKVDEVSADYLGEGHFEAG
jgi:hypothetical protein